MAPAGRDAPMPSGPDRDALLPSAFRRSRHAPPGAGSAPSWRTGRAGCSAGGSRIALRGARDRGRSDRHCATRTAARPGRRSRWGLFPELVVGGLPAADARLLLAATLPGPLDVRVRDRILSEARGNPLALLELPRGQIPADLAGGFGLPGAMPLTSRIEQGFARQLEPLPPGTRRLLLLAAAESVGDVTLIWRAAALLGVGPEAAGPAQAAGLLKIRAGVRFRHPLVRSAAYRAATAPDRRRAHEALAAASEPHLDPERRAWHRAQAADGPDADVAAELERRRAARQLVAASRRPPRSSRERQS